MNTFQKLMTCTVALACLMAPVAASPVGGERYDVHRVAAYSTDAFHVTFRAYEDATVIISGDGDTDLDLYVFDEYGNLIGSDTDGSDDCVVRFWPGSTRTYRIEVRNLGSVYNQYEIACL